MSCVWGPERATLADTCGANEMLWSSACQHGFTRPSPPRISPTLQLSWMQYLGIKPPDLCHVIRQRCKAVLHDCGCQSMLVSQPKCDILFPLFMQGSSIATQKEQFSGHKELSLVEVFQEQLFCSVLHRACSTQFGSITFQCQKAWGLGQSAEEVAEQNATWYNCCKFCQAYKEFNYCIFHIDPAVRPNHDSLFRQITEAPGLVSTTHDSTSTCHTKGYKRVFQPLFSLSLSLSRALSLSLSLSSRGKSLQIGPTKVSIGE